MMIILILSQEELQHYKKNRETSTTLLSSISSVENNELLSKDNNNDETLRNNRQQVKVNKASREEETEDTFYCLDKKFDIIQQRILDISKILKSLNSHDNDIHTNINLVNECEGKDNLDFNMIPMNHTMNEEQGQDVQKLDFVGDYFNSIMVEVKEFNTNYPHEEVQRFHANATTIQKY